MVTGASDEQGAFTLYETSKAILKEGGFNLRKFCSNSSLLQMLIDKQEMSDPPHISTTFEADVMRVLQLVLAMSSLTPEKGEYLVSVGIFLLTSL